MQVQVERFRVGFCVLVVAATSFIHAGAQEKPEKQQVFRIDSQIYTFRATEIGMTNNDLMVFLSTISEDSFALPGDPELSIGDTQVEYGGELVKINGKDGPRSTDDLRLLAAPSVMALKRQKAVIVIQDSTPIQYLERWEFAGNGFTSTPFEESLEDRPEGDPLLNVVNIDFRDMNIGNVIALLAEKGGINVIPHSSVDETLKVNANLKNIPLGKAFAAVLKQHDLGLVGEDNLYRVVRIDGLDQTDLGEDCCYSIKEIDDDSGIELSVEVLNKSNAEEISLRTALMVTIVEERKPLPGVTLDAGKPKVTKLRTRTDVKVQEGHWIGILSTTQSGTCTLALLNVTAVDSLPERGEEGEAEAATDESTAASVLEDLSDAKQTVRQYALEAKFLTYEGRLDKDRVKALRGTLGVETSNEDVFRLVDGILPARRGDIDMFDLDSWGKDVGAKFALLSVPRITFPERGVLKDSVKIVLASPRLNGDFGNPELVEQLLHRMLPSDRELPISKDELGGMAVIADIVQQFIPYKKFWSNGARARTNQRIEAHTGVLLLAGAEDIADSDRMNLDVYCQFSAIKDDAGEVAEDRNEAFARFSITEFRDQPVVVDGGTVWYLHSVSDKEHRLVALTVTQQDVTVRSGSLPAAETALFRAR